MDAVSGRVGAAIDRAESRLIGRIPHQGSGMMPGAIRPPVAFQSDIVLPDATAVGPEVVVGADCELAADVCIVQSVLWPRVRVGRGATIERSLVMNDVIIPDGSHLVGKIVSPETIIDL
jgi:NDP-sugar pyrophosphorylase family protein